MPGKHCEIRDSLAVAGRDWQSQEETASPGL